MTGAPLPPGTTYPHDQNQVRLARLRAMEATLRGSKEAMTIPELRTLANLSRLAGEIVEGGHRLVVLPINGEDQIAKFFECRDALYGQGGERLVTTAFITALDVRGNLNTDSMQRQPYGVVGSRQKALEAAASMRVLNTLVTSDLSLADSAEEINRLTTASDQHLLGYLPGQQRQANFVAPPTAVAVMLIEGGSREHVGYATTAVDYVTQTMQVQPL